MLYRSCVVKKPHGAVLAWLKSVSDDDLFLSVVTLAEIQAGIELTRDQGLLRAAELERWLNQIAESYLIFCQWMELFFEAGKANVQTIRYFV